MEILKGKLVLPVLLLLVSCSNTSGTASAFTHAGLSEAQREQQGKQCLEQATAAESDYYAKNTKGEANALSPFINNLKVRQRSMAVRNESFDACMQAAGFSRQQ